MKWRGREGHRQDKKCHRVINCHLLFVAIITKDSWKYAHCGTFRRKIYNDDVRGMHHDLGIRCQSQRWYTCSLSYIPCPNKAWLSEVRNIELGTGKYTWYKEFELKSRTAIQKLDRTASKSSFPIHFRPNSVETWTQQHRWRSPSHTSKIIRRGLLPGVKRRRENRTSMTR